MKAFFSGLSFRDFPESELFSRQLLFHQAAVFDFAQVTSPGRKLLGKLLQQRVFGAAGMSCFRLFVRLFDFVFVFF
ncbi:hypothetical protein M5E84_06995 [[Ruminococcus] torques]|nr:hypothetical protein M5E84_06995 [[Ruminococcus] torques]